MVLAILIFLTKFSRQDLSKTVIIKDNMRLKRTCGLCILFTFLMQTIGFGQSTIKGKVNDSKYGDPLIGANVVVKGTTDGNVTDYDGFFELKTTNDFPLTLVFSYLGYVEKEVIVNSADEKVNVKLEENSITINVVEVKASRISEETKKSPLTIESMDLLAVKETPASNFYEGLGALKGVDLTTASLGFQIVNTRGFNSTSPVRSLQVIDGVDNQAPGLNFSLGNFLGSSELDVLKVDMVVGASSAFYGPNAFNGVVSMETKSPFFHKGLSASIKLGERSLIKPEIRWADAFKNSDGDDWFAYKLNLSYFKADDWEARNSDPVFDTDTGRDNIGGWDQVNTYGDEYLPNLDQSDVVPWQSSGLETWHRTGYEENQIVDYNTENLKSNATLHFRTSPSDGVESPEFIISSSYSRGTTVYQGDNRFSLKNIEFFQNRLEFRKNDKYFIRAYMTKDDAGDSYDPYFTALLLQQKAKNNILWGSDYSNYWNMEVYPKLLESGYPELEVEIIDGLPVPFYDYDALDAWRADPVNQAALLEFHKEATAVANTGVAADFTQDFYQPGTARFDSLFNKIISTPSGDPQGGTKFIDRSALYHAHGEYKFEPTFLDYLRVGANARLYTPNSEGTVFVDSIESVNINTFEYGVYGGFQKALVANELKLSGTVRLDHNENFDPIPSYAASLVWNPNETNFLRLSFSSAIRNPTLTDQYLDLNVGRAILRGHLDTIFQVATLESFDDYLRSGGIADTLRFFDIDPIKPEKVRSYEVGYRTTLFGSTFVDASYYYSTYNDFIGYNLGIDLSIEDGRLIGAQAYRYSANSKNTVNTQGFSIGLNHYINNFKIGGNYSWNNLLKTVEDDPIIPAFNTPEHKYNLSFSGRNLEMPNNRGKFGFNVNYKWVQGFIFEGSPQFSGALPSYGLLDAQVNYNFPRINSTIKVGASNILNNLVYQTYGGPLIGRMAYITYTYEFKKD